MSSSRGGSGRGLGGAYYREKYGRGGGRGRGGRHGGGRGRGMGHGGEQHEQIRSGSYDELVRLLQSIDGQQYPRYHELETSANGGWQHHDFMLQIGRTQSDPFAPPTRCRLILDSHLPAEVYRNPTRRMACSDFLLRRLYQTCQQAGAHQSLQGSGWSGPKGGDVQILAPTQHVIEQSAVQINAEGQLRLQLTVNLPARGRTILGQAAETIFNRVLPQLIQSLSPNQLDLVALTHHVESVEDQVWLQSQLHAAGLVAFCRNGAILPRASGVDDRPMTHEVIPFQSPPTLERSFTLPNAKTIIHGLGIPHGITLICGGGFHGKSTLLQALQLGVYPKIPGDGREFCVTSPVAVKIRAEDGRAVTNVDISPFINNLPFNKETRCFSTLDASGSTSQAANIVESLELGADTLLIDEDTCATNFMIRDHKMMQLVANEKEPITPFVRVAPSLWQERNVSTVLVIGGAGDYFDIANHVLLMDCYQCVDASARAKAIATQSPAALGPVPFGAPRERKPVRSTFAAGGKIKAQSVGIISYGGTELDIRALEQVVSVSQTNTIAFAVQKFATLQADGNLRDALLTFESSIDSEGLNFLAANQFQGSLTRPRYLEIGGALNRLRRNGSMQQC